MKKQNKKAYFRKSYFMLSSNFFSQNLEKKIDDLYASWIFKYINGIMLPQICTEYSCL